MIGNCSSTIFWEIIGKTHGRYLFYRILLNHFNIFSPIILNIVSYNMKHALKNKNITKATYTSHCGYSLVLGQDNRD